MTLDNVYVEFSDSRIGVIGDFNSNWLPPGAFNARDEELTVIPGLIDVHVHGAGGTDFLTTDLEELKEISYIAARGGCTTMVATRTFSAHDNNLENFRAFIKMIRDTNTLACGKGTADDSVCTLPGARIVGLHLEGPFLNPARRGAFTEEFLSLPNPEIVREIIDICGDLLLKVTIAPELPGAEEAIRIFTEEAPFPIEVSLGHTVCDFALGMKMFENPRARQITHVFNAMNGLHHRDSNLLTAALIDERVSFEIIGDGLHVTPPVVTVLHKTVGAKRLIAITDGASAMGLPTGSIVNAFAGEAMVHPDSGVRRTADHVLIGTAAVMSDVFFRLQHLCDISFEDSLLMSTYNPAKSINREDQVGTVEKGKRADFVVIKGDQVVATIRDGMLVYQA